MVFLSADLDVLFERVSRNQKRPLLQTADPRGTLQELIQRRWPLYTECAHFTVDTSVGSHADIAHAVLAQARRYFSEKRPHNRPAVKIALLDHARELGFALCRVARCDAPPHAASFVEWLDAGMAGEMTPWLERGKEKRADPQMILPGARSMIVLGLNYWQGPRPAPVPDAPATGRFARYAWGDDYHDLIGDKLRALDAFLQNHGGQQRFYVDTGPVLERDFAAEAGAGWHGKSTMLLHPELGTWFFPRRNFDDARN